MKVWGRGQKFGILVAANGITGNPHDSESIPSTHRQGTEPGGLVQRARYFSGVSEGRFSCCRAKDTTEVYRARCTGILVVTRAEIMALRSSADLVRLLQLKLTQLVVRQTSLP